MNEASLQEKLSKYINNMDNQKSAKLFENIDYSEEVISGFISRALKDYTRESSINPGQIINEKGIFGINIELSQQEMEEINKLISCVEGIVETIIKSISEKDSDWANFENLIQDQIDKTGSYGINNRIKDDDDSKVSKKVITGGIKPVPGISTSKQNKTLYLAKEIIKDMKDDLKYGTMKGKSAISFAKQIQQLLNIAKLAKNKLIW